MPRLVRLFALLLVAGTAGSPVRADDPAPDSPADLRVRELTQRLERLENQVLEMRAKQGEPIPAGGRKVLAIVETPFLGSTSYGSPSGRRYVAARLVFVNLTNEQIVVEPPKIKLHVDGAEKEYKPAPSNMQYYSFQINGQSHQLRNIKPTPKLSLRPGATGSTWIAYFELPQTNDVPSMVLEIPIGEESMKVDVNRSAKDSLAMSVERIGPSRSLGLITIGGSFNTINAGSLVDALDHLITQKVARVVIRWSDSAAPLDSTVWNWLQQAAAYAGRQEMPAQQLPILPAAIRELHLAGAPGQSARSRSSYGNFSTEGRIHEKGEHAVAAALRTAYEVLPREQLLVEIREGDAHTRAAAIAAGGGRLSSDHLPMLLGFVDDDDPVIQEAAIRALRHFGEQQAIDKLVGLVRKNTKPLGTAAIESLARSRFPAANEALLGVLANEPPKSKVEIVKVLANYPRPVWADTIYEFVHSDDQTVAVAALNALVQIGHPKLFDVLKSHLEGGNSTLENQAFSTLVNRTDPESEELAMTYTLKKLEKSPPSSSMYNLLNRTKDPRAIPPLLKYFNTTSNNRSQIINTLAQIGDEVVADAFAEKYNQLQDHEKVSVLRALQQMRSPAFRDLAEKALMTADSSLISAACEGLRMYGGPGVAEMLGKALEQTSNTSAMSYISNTLGQLATPDAKQALMKARQSTDSNKSRYANQALRNLYQRSPGYSYMYQARSRVQQKNYKEAVKQFDIALTLDPDLPEALAERGNSHLNLGNLDKARKDYKRALEIDAWNSHAITGTAILLAREGSVDAAVEFVEDQQKKHPNDAVFAYNTACVYGRSVESLKQDDDADPDRVDELRGKAIAELARAKQLGFSDIEWMKKDPDLKSLHGDPEFDAIHSPKTEGEGGSDEGPVATEAAINAPENAAPPVFRLNLLR